MTPKVAMLAVDPYWCRHHRVPRCDFECLPETLFGIARLFLCTYKSKMGSDSSDSLSEREFAYGVYGYMFEPTRSDMLTMLKHSYK